MRMWAAVYIMVIGNVLDSERGYAFLMFAVSTFNRYVFVESRKRAQKFSINCNIRRKKEILKD